MIGKLKGIINVFNQDYVIVDVNGVGYIVYCPKDTISQLRDKEMGELWIETEVKQDSIQLYGFLTLDDKRWFNLLQSVQGVGAKVALNILSAYSSQVLASVLMNGDKIAFQKINGIGPKLAQRILLEMSDKLPKHIANNATFLPLNNGSSSVSSEAISAFVNLGFNRTTAMEAVKSICDKEPGLSLEDVIKKGLQLMR